MTTQMNIAEAKAKLSSLVQKALDGEEVIIARDGVPAVKIIPVAAASQPRRRPGLWREMGWTGAPTPYEVFEPDPEDATESPLFPDDPNS